MGTRVGKLYKIGIGKRELAKERVEWVLGENEESEE